jgi:hypothetical protein
LELAHVVDPVFIDRRVFGAIAIRNEGEANQVFLIRFLNLLLRFLEGGPMGDVSVGIDDHKDYSSLLSLFKKNECPIP